MPTGRIHDVAIVGAGPAGITAAIALARAGADVVVLEGGLYPGSENWSGAVYFTETLSKLLGSAAVEALPFERRIVRRGVAMTDGVTSLELNYTEHPTEPNEVFKDCYTVLRPIYDRALAEVAQGFGATILTSTTVEGLLRSAGRVVGVSTERGPLRARAVFLAEGDASHLVRKEGYLTAGVRTSFLHGVKEVVALDRRIIDDRFGLGGGGGACLEILLRNPSVDGKTLPLSAGGFVYTNADSLSIGIVLPLENMRSFRGQYNTLAEWYKQLPVIQRLIAGGETTGFGAKVIRGGGVRQVSQLVADGLAIGGAAAGLGVDFPYPNYTGPATASGLLFAQAFLALDRSRSGFSATSLRTAYVEPLCRTRYWRDMQHLAAWPHYVESSRAFFGAQIDAAVQGANLLTDPALGLGQKLWRLPRVLIDCLPRRHRFATALDLMRGFWILGTPSAALRALPRAIFAPPRGIGPWRNRPCSEVQVAVRGADGRARAMPAQLAWLGGRFRAALAGAMAEVYRNDDQPLPAKARRATVQLLKGQVFRILLLKLWFVALLAARVTSDFFWSLLRRKAKGGSESYRQSARTAADLGRVQPARDHDSKLGEITYENDHRSHIRVFFPLEDPAASSLWSVCPAKVYQRETDASGSTSVAVLHENCVKCETCLIAEPAHVDWSRFRGQRLAYEVYSKADSPDAAARVLASAIPAARPSVYANRLRSPELAHPMLAPLAVTLSPPPAAPTLTPYLAEVADQVDAVLLQARALRAAIDRSPAVLELFHREWFKAICAEMEAATIRLDSTLQRGAAAAALRDAIGTDGQGIFDLLLPIARSARSNADEDRFFAAEADARQLAEWPLAAMSLALSGLLGRPPASAPAQPVRTRAELLLGTRLQLRARLAERFPRARVKSLDDGAAFSADERALLAELLAGVADRSARIAVLAELGRVDLSLGVLAASHLGARDACLAAGLAQVSSLAMLVIVPAREDRREFSIPYALPALAAEVVLCEGAGTLTVLSADHAALQFKQTGGIGLRAGRPSRLRISTGKLPHAASGASPTLAGQLRRGLWRDHLAVALGASEYLLERAREHAESRVQFPNMFRDRRGRDGIVKFGAVRAMLGGIAANGLLLEALVFEGDPADDEIVAALHRVAGLEAHGPRLSGSSYLAGQLFGGMAYSEDDDLAKHYRDASALMHLTGTQEQLARLAGAEMLAALRAAGNVSSDEAAGLIAAAVNQAKLSADAASPAGAAAAAEVGFALAAEAGATAARRYAQQLFVAGHARAEIAAAAADILQERAAEVVACLPEVLKAIPVRVWLGAELLAAGHLDSDVPPATAATYDYAKHVLGDGSTYESGALLASGEVAPGRRHVPEGVWHDARLRASRERLRDCFLDRFRGREPGKRKRFGPKKLLYQRMLDEIHQVPRDDIEWLACNGFYRLFIPAAQGGEGATKAEYYELCSASMRYADPGVSLTIQATSSIGTTPILIGLKKDLAAAASELAGPLAAPEAFESLVRALGDLETMATEGRVPEIEPAYLALRGIVEDSLRRPRTVRAVFGKALAAFDRAGLAGKSGDLETFTQGIVLCRGELAGWRARLEGASREIAPRKAAHEFYLRLVASGRVSAFALTEPSAGSDTARIRTRAVPKSVELQRDPRGFYRFRLGGEGGPWRHLADMRRFEFDFESGRSYYRLGFDDAEGTRAPVEQNDYVYDPGEKKMRVLEIGGARIPLHDLAIPRREESADGAAREVYDYFEVDGSKMWITNGHIAGVFCLYARTERGPTGFMLDGHAEGLVVGKDEEKMGQRGGPTNELTLSGVRIPTCCIIGIEGRGQENALETLNVGRAGLLVSSVAVLADLADDVILDLPKLAPESVSPAAPYWIGRFAEKHFACESLAANLTGLMDHPGTRSARLESAIGKYFGGDCLHHTLDWVEHAYGAEAASAEHDLEKKRRDGRIINIYEGTNEVQRFLILKDLIAGAAGWKPGVATTAQDGHESLLLSTRERLRGCLQAAEKAWGERCWKSVRHQPIFFRLAEMAAWVQTADATLHRRRWVHAQLTDARDASRVRRVDGAAVSFTLRSACLNVWRLAALFDAELEELVREGREPSVLRLADLVVDAGDQEDVGESPESFEGRPDHDSREGSENPLEVVVILSAAPMLAPRPRLTAGQIAEPLWQLDGGSRAALAHAKLLGSERRVSITALAAGGRRCARALRDALAAGANRGVWLDMGEASADAGSQARAIGTWLRGRGAASSLVVAGRSGGKGLPSLVGELGLEVAGQLEWPVVTDACEVRIGADRSIRARGDGTGGEWVEIRMPAAVILRAGAQAGCGPVDVERQVWAERTALDRVAAELEADEERCAPLRMELPASPMGASGVAAPSSTTPEEAARELTAAAGLAVSHIQDERPSYAGKLPRQSPGEGERAVVIAGRPDEVTEQACAARELGRALGLPWHAWLWLPGATEDELRAAAGSAALDGAAEVWLVDTRALVGASPSGTAEALALMTGESLVLAAASLHEAVWLAQSRQKETGGGMLPGGAVVDRLEVCAAEGLVILQGAAGGRLRARTQVPSEGAVGLLAVTSRLEVAGGGSGAGRTEPAEASRVCRADLSQLAYDASQDVIARALAGAMEHLGVKSLADADFIIDIGYGVGTPDGLEAVLLPLQEALRAHGVANVMVGATRKVTQDLGLLPSDQQIGQTGVAVNPRVLLALGVSGAPQHLSYIGKDAVIFAFNRDPDAPLMTLGKRQARPRVFPIQGDLFRTIPRFIAALSEPRGANTEAAKQ